jgi:hypothetical protein
MALFGGKGTFWRGSYSTRPASGGTSDLSRGIQPHLRQKHFAMEIDKNKLP